jgi:hypothetical protein
MKALPVTADLVRVARRVLWFEEPERALADPLQFLAHVKLFGEFLAVIPAKAGIYGRNISRPSSDDDIGEVIHGVNDAARIN